MAKTYERTAITPFKLAGEHVPAGKVVKLTAPQMRTAIAAGVVHSGEEENASVPVVNAATGDEALAEVAGNEAHAPSTALQMFIGGAPSNEAQLEAVRVAQEQAELVAEQARKDAEAKRVADLAEEQAQKDAEAKRLQGAAAGAPAGAGKTNAPAIPPKP